MHGVYVLYSKKDGELYIGYSAEVRRRIDEHTRGQVTATRTRRPLVIILCESFANKKDALQREKYFKTGWGRNHLRKMLYHTLEELGVKI